MKDVSTHDFVAAFAQHLKKSGKVEVPDYVDYVKTGVSKELAPYDEDWYFVRMASVARRVYVGNKSGINALRRAYGGNYRRGVRTETFSMGGGKVIRNCLQTLQKLKFVEEYNGTRRISSAGRRAMDQVAQDVASRS